MFWLILGILVVAAIAVWKYCLSSSVDDYDDYDYYG